MDLIPSDWLLESGCDDKVSVMKRKLDISGARDKREKKKSRKIFPYGNMDRYYGYRSVDNPKEVDKRIEILMKYKSNIEDRNCLDVGCNCGKLTFQIGLIQLSTVNLVN